MQKAKQLSFTSVLLLGINGIVGSGIFLLPTELYNQAGWGSLLAIFIAGAATTLVAANYAILARWIDTDGGAWVYAEQAYGDFAGFITGWIGWFLGIITIAAEIAAFLTTLGGIWAPAKNPLTYSILSLVILLTLAIVNLFGQRIVKFADNLASGVKIAIIAVFLITGAIFFFRQGASLPKATAGGAPVGQLVGASIAAFYMYTGFSFLPVAAHEMRNPSKVLPRALVVVMVSVTSVYLLIQALTLGILGDGLKTATLPVAEALGVVLGPIGRSVILSGMLISIIGVALAVSFSTPVGAASLANEKQLLPREVGKMNRFGSPVFAIVVTIGVAAALVLSGGYLFLVKLIVLGSFLQYLITAAAAITLNPRYHGKPGWHRYLIPVATIILVLGLMTQFSLQNYLLTLGVLALGGVVYWLDRRRQKNEILTKK